MLWQLTTIRRTRYRSGRTGGNILNCYVFLMVLDDEISD